MCVILSTNFITLRTNAAEMCMDAWWCRHCRMQCLGLVSEVAMWHIHSADRWFGALGLGHVFMFPAVFIMLYYY